MNGEKRERQNEIYICYKSILFRIACFAIDNNATKHVSNMGRSELVGGLITMNLFEFLSVIFPLFHWNSFDAVDPFSDLLFLIDVSTSRYVSISVYMWEPNRIEALCMQVLSFYSTVCFNIERISIFLAIDRKAHTYWCEWWKKGHAFKILHLILWTDYKSKNFRVPLLSFSTSAVQLVSHSDYKQSSWW